MKLPFDILYLSLSVLCILIYIQATFLVGPSLLSLSELDFTCLARYLIIPVTQTAPFGFLVGTS